jgi:WD40 repeat protein
MRHVNQKDVCRAGHSEAILTVQFSPDGKQLASGAGDCTVRFWDLNTQTPLLECKVRTRSVQGGTRNRIEPALFSSNEIRVVPPVVKFFTVIILDMIGIVIMYYYYHVKKYPGCCDW